MTYPSYGTLNPSRVKVWNFDTVVCAFFLFTSSYFILEALVKGAMGSTRFQIDWIFLIIANLRIVMINGSHQRSLESDALKRAIQLFVPIFFVAAYTAAISLSQPNFLIEHGLYFDSISDGFIIRRGAKYIAYLGFSLYFASVINTWEKFYSVLLFLVYGLCISEIAGLIQAIIFTATGVDILPITRTRETGLFYLSATVDFLGLKVLRINSLSHEPKGLAGAMFILFIFKFYAEQFLHNAKQYVFVNGIFENYLKITWPLTVLVLLLTFSGSGFFVLGINLVVIFSFQIWGFLISGNLFQQGRITTIFLIVITLMISFNPEYITSFLDISILRRMPTLFEGGIYGPVDELGLDPEDTASITQIMRYPQVALYGIGFGGFANVTLPLVASFYSGGISIEQASSFSRNIFIECLFSSGLIGLSGIFLFARNIFRNVRKGIIVCTILILLIGSSFLLRSNEPIFFVCIGLSVSLSNLNWSDL